MQAYADLSGHSGICAYELRPGAILIEFRSHDRYLYTNRIPGRRHVQAMRRLAAAGQGLSTYISKHVREKYAAKLS